MTRLLSSFFLILGLTGLILFSSHTTVYATQDCSKYSNNPPYYERCMQIQKSIQRMNDSKAKRNKRLQERRERVNKSFRSQRDIEAKKKENAEKTTPANSENTETTEETNTETTEQAPNTQPSTTDTASTPESSDNNDPQLNFIKSIPPRYRIVIDSRKLTTEQFVMISSLLKQISAQPTPQQPATTAPVQNTQKPVTKTIRRPTRPMTPISPSGGNKRMIKLPDVGMGDSGYAPIEPLDPNDLARP